MVGRTSDRRAFVLEAGAKRRHDIVGLGFRFDEDAAGKRAWLWAVSILEGERKESPHIASVLSFWKNTFFECVM